MNQLTDQAAEALQHATVCDGLAAETKDPTLRAALWEAAAILRDLALLAPPRQPKWKLVPVLPTTDMLYAMAECDGYRRDDRDHLHLTRWEDYWHMALSAVPPPTTAETAYAHAIKDAAQAARDMANRLRFLPKAIKPMNDHYAYAAQQLDAAAAAILGLRKAKP